MLLVELIGWCSVIVCSQTTGVLILWLLGRDSNAGQCQPLTVTGHGLLLRSDKAVHR